MLLFPILIAKVIHSFFPQQIFLGDKIQLKPYFEFIYLFIFFAHTLVV
jgi:hypothetical protein